MKCAARGYTRMVINLAYQLVSFFACELINIGKIAQGAARGFSMRLHGFPVDHDSFCVPLCYEEAKNRLHGNSKVGSI